MALLQVIDEGDDRFVVNVAAIMLFGLVVARMAGLVRQQERSVARERILSAAGADLVAATSRDDICRAALAAARSLAGDEVVARLCLAEGDGVIVADAELGAAWPVSAPAAAALLAPRAQRRLAAPPVGEHARGAPTPHVEGDALAAALGARRAPRRCSSSPATSTSPRRSRAASPPWRPRSRSRSRARR